MTYEPPDLVVGVLGGLGPEATLDFFAKVLAHSRAATDQDHLHLIIENNPQIPNRNEAIAGTGPSPAPELAAGARALERAGADFIVMPCNTAHAFEDAIRNATSLPFVGIVDATLDHLVACRSDVGRAGVIGTSGCRGAALYERALEARGIASVDLDEAEQTRFMKLLYRIKAGEHGEAIRSGMRTLGEALHGRGAEVVIAACTEVPLVLEDGELPCPLFDSTDILAALTVRLARRELPLPL